MLIWLILLIFGVPVVAIIIQSLKKDQSRSNRLDQIQARLKEKEFQAIEEKRQAIKNKNQAGR